MLEQPTIVTRTRSHCAAYWRDVYFNVWLAPGGVADVRASVAHQKAFARKVDGGKMAQFTVVHKAAVAPVDGAMREALGVMRKELNPLIKVGALVIPIDGFAGAVLRSILVGMSFVARAAYPNNVLTSERDAFRWVARYIAPDGVRAITADDLGAVYADIMAAPLTQGTGSGPSALA